MEITWHGDSTFTIKGKKTTLVVDPKDGLKADTVLMTDDYDEKAKPAKGLENANTINWPGEYEYQGAAIVAIPAYTKEQKEGDTAAGRILVYSMEVDDIRFCHLAELGKELDEEVQSKIGDVDILMVSAASKKALTVKELHKAIEAIDPRVIIPMNFKDQKELDELLKELGITEHEKLDVFEIKAKSQLPEDKTDFIELKPV